MDGIKKISENVIRQGRALTLTSNYVQDSEAIPAGTIRCDAGTGGLLYKISTNNWSRFNPNSMLLHNSIDTDLIMDRAIHNDQLGDQSVDQRVLRNNSISKNKLMHESVDSDIIKEYSIYDKNLANNCISTQKLKDYCITNTKIAENAINGSKLMINSINNDKLINNSITGHKIADNSIGGEKILNNSITVDKIRDAEIVGNKIADNTISTRNIVNYAITTAKLDTGSVTTDKLANGSITKEKLSNIAIDGSVIMHNSISENHLQDKSVTNRKLQDKVISKNNLDTILNNTITNLDENAIKYDSNNNVLINRSNSNLIVSGNIQGAKVFNSVYKDIAEAYIPGESLNPGDIVEIRDDYKVYKASGGHCIVGVVSDEYASCYGADPQELETNKKIAIGLIGRVHVNVLGAVSIGDYICLDKHGFGKAIKKRDLDYKIHDVIGKSLIASNEEHIKKVECLIFPN